MRAEALGDLDALMATVSPLAAYTSFNSGPDAPDSPRSRDEVAKYYGGIVAANCHPIEHDLDRIVADRNNVTIEGTLRIAYPDAALRAMGYTLPGDAPYLFDAASISRHSPCRRLPPRRPASKPVAHAGKLPHPYRPAIAEASCSRSHFSPTATSCCLCQIRLT
ncbi:hypothetical protein BLA18112_06746 [Burkholderia lata]|uniref:SnoaL-like domain-containing protein n=1 Tax=Burkholderia lata (strain ATCC 17760 / DSM 23089 / LMG 22485 / NCIMB 9086 / R18194 / 383) TaxID=482957 RepID=A0A6P2ZZZ1_BURL3|nr:nuclear transport factor 2 family protein [Burkholderia lata]VWD40621.1 hypothetical protein BLA18112_06746 [Burkholderia lata]